MNYDEARELRNGGWHWTTMNDGIIRTAWPCHQHVGDESDPQWYLNPYSPDDWVYCHPHLTRQDAEEHFYEASLNDVSEIALRDLAGCIVCDTPTKKALGNHGLSKAFSLSITPFCDDHRSKRHLALEHPFKPGLKLIHS